MQQFFLPGRMIFFSKKIFLLTSFFRTPLCNKRAKNVTDSKCDTLGLTELGTMCNSSSKCALVRDNGFATAFTIAHEIAHL
jgi:hypothetical protein